MTLSILVPSELEEALSRRLKKLGASAGVTVTLVPGETRLIRDKHTLACRRITVGELPHVGGWVFVAKLEHLKEGNVITRGPDERESDLTSWRTLPALCTHCNTKRRRSETFLLRSPSGELRQIARNCLADFVCGDASRLLRAAELVAELGDCMGEERWGSYRWGVAPVAFIACAVSAIEAEGYRKSNEEGSTAGLAEFIAGDRPRNAHDAEHWTQLQPTDEHVARAEAAVAWIAVAYRAPGSSEYLWNLRIAVGEPDVGKHAGLLASAVVAHERHLGREVTSKLARAQSGVASGYAAPVGEVFQGEAVLLRRAVIESPFGSKSICTFRSLSTNHELVWFATGRAPTEIGERFTLKGRVKKHESYRGVTQTVLQRVRFQLAEISARRDQPPGAKRLTTAEEVLEKIARQHDRDEILCRRIGMYDAAVCAQYIAQGLRDRAPTVPLRGMGCTDLYAMLSNERFYWRGDISDEDIQSFGRSVEADDVSSTALIGHTQNMMATFIQAMNAGLPYVEALKTR